MRYTFNVKCTFILEGEIKMKNLFFKKASKMAALLIAFALIFAGCSNEVNNDAAPGSDKGGSGGSNYWKADNIDSSETDVTANTDVNIKYSDFDGKSSPENDFCTIKFDGNTAAVTGVGAQVVNDDYTQVKITLGGTYIVEGHTDNGQIYVEAGENQVHLILNGVKIHCEKSAPIYVINGKKTVGVIIR